MHIDNWMALCSAEETSKVESCVSSVKKRFVLGSADDDSGDEDGAQENREECSGVRGIEAEKMWHTNIWLEKQIRLVLRNQSICTLTPK